MKNISIINENENRLRNLFAKKSFQKRKKLNEGTKIEYNEIRRTKREYHCPIGILSSFE